jgi:transposase
MYHIEITPEELTKLQQQARLMRLGDDVLKKLEWFLYYLESGESVSQTCKHFGIARSTFYRWLQRFDPSDLHTLEEKSHRPRMLRKPKITQTVVDLVRIYRMQNPFIGKDQIAELLLTEHNADVSASTVGRIIAQHNLYFGNSVLHRRKRRELSGAETLQDELPSLEEAEEIVVESETKKPQSELGEFVQAGKSLVRYVWGHFRRPIIVVSILSNLALIVLFLMTAMWESRIAEERSVQEAAIIIETEGRAAAPDTPQIEIQTIVHE